MGHSNDSCGLFDDEDAVVLGRDLVAAEGDDGGERPAALSVLAESSQNVSVNFSAFQ